ncbi:prenyltransferase/squalene oxidase repeat-containing protein [Kitasatospora brasiliensis]|uniref:prenyltransferase/squalene oxidase repeat-containing protein n=1 Tax=Kitasatospora brasiliensis TaxID=3058040 RepID=UPI00292FAAA7|nr:prenyltransferase/squalene oxidase repeat-containing protein [Kitasatospora sp. K002]
MTTNASAESALRADLDQALAETIDALFELQRSDGSWEGRLSPSAGSTADVVIAMHLADPEGCADLIERGVDFLLRTQGEDGGWGDDVDTGSTLNGTALTVAALALVVPERAAENIRRGWRRVEEFGGMEAVRDVQQCSLTVLVHFYLALAGLVSDEDLLRVPIEIALLPAPLRKKLTFAMPTAMAWGLMAADRPGHGRMRRAINRAATPKAIEYLVGLVGFEGPNGGFVESPMMSANVVIGLTIANQRPDIVDHCLKYFRATIKPEGAWSVTRDLEVDATNFITVGMQHAGLGDDARVRKGLDWIRGAQRPEEFIWTGAPSGGWGWGLPSGWPNSGNTGDAVIALSGGGADVSDPQVRQGADWLLKQQNYDGSWSCFAQVGRIASLDPSFALVGKARSPKVLYGPCAVMSAEAVSALGLSGACPQGDPRLVQAYQWFRSIQRADGGIDNKWYTGRVTGTGSVLRALGDIGLGHTEVARRGVGWLRLNQNPDGGWGQTPAPDGPSTAEETAMAMLGLVAVGTDPLDPVLVRGARWLIDNRNDAALWNPSLVGVYFLELLYRHDHTANGYALQALARYREALNA